MDNHPELTTQENPSVATSVVITVYAVGNSVHRWAIDRDWWATDGPSVDHRWSPVGKPPRKLIFPHRWLLVVHRWPPMDFPGLSVRDTLKNVFFSEIPIMTLGNNDTSNTTRSSVSSSASFEPYEIEYTRLMHIAESMLPFFEWSTVLSIVGSVFCFILNASLLYCLLTIDEFKNLFFFPIGLQAFIDLIGPGLSNLVYMILSFYNFRSMTSIEDGGVPMDFDTMFNNQIITGIFQLCYFAPANSSL